MVLPDVVWGTLRRTVLTTGVGTVSLETIADLGGAEGYRARGRIVSAFLEVGSDLDPARAVRNPLVVRRLRLVDEGQELPRDRPDGTTSLVVQVFRELLPVEDSAIDEVIALGALEGDPLAVQPMLAAMQELALSLVDEAHLPFAIEPSWTRAFASTIVALTGRTPSPSVVAESRRALIERIVERFSWDPRLTSQSLADTLQISRRTLYDLTSDRFGGISEYIRVARIRHAALMLTDPDSDDMSIAEVARRAGFASVKNLKRALISFYGEPPATIRATRQAHELEVRVLPPGDE